MVKYLFLLLFSLLTFSAYSQALEPLELNQPLRVITIEEKNMVRIKGRFNLVNVSKWGDEIISKASKLKPEEPIYLVINSGGGSIGAGRLLIDIARGIPNPIHTITLYAGSMAFNLVQYMDQRLVIHVSKLMTHDAYMSQFSCNSLKRNCLDQMDMALKDLNELEKHIAKRLGLTLEQYKKITELERESIGARNIQEGFADELVRVRCGESLIGYFEEEYTNPYNGQEGIGKFSKCPLIVFPLEVEYNSTW